jgi:hypothetical protein
MVAEWAFRTHDKLPFMVDRAIGIVDKGVLVGAALFGSYNGCNANLSYYGKDTVTLGIIRALTRIALYELHLTRCTVIVPKRPSYLMKKLHRFGFRYEGVQRRFYGPTDAPRDTGCRFVIFREDMEKLIAERSEKVA